MSKQVAPAKTPDIAGPGGRRAWRVTHPDEERDFPASCGQWLVEQPGAHPFWNFYVCGCVDLVTPSPDGKPPHLRFPEATHEFLIAALNPDAPVPAVDRWEGVAMLRPIDLVHQVELPRLDVGATILDLLVKNAVEQGTSLDEDNRRAWMAILDTTALHYREGLH